MPQGYLSEEAEIVLGLGGEVGRWQREGLALGPCGLSADFIEQLIRDSVLESPKGLGF